VKLSGYFVPVLREVPSEAQVKSHQLMLRAGMIRKSSSGIYSWLPIGIRVLDRIRSIIRRHQMIAGSNEMIMPTIQPADLWKESGRYGDYGRELLSFQDRHGREMLYGPTNEELITDIFRGCVSSYRELPLHLYHIQWKFRDEIRPRFGVMRSREFLMKDGYSFDISFEDAMRSYSKIMVSYLSIFEEIGVKAIPIRAESGPIGGSYSHEFVMLADTGETTIYADQELLDLQLADCNFSYDDFTSLQKIVDLWTGYYAETDDICDVDNFKKVVPKERQAIRKGIEVGHIFYFGTKYSSKMNARVINSQGQQQEVAMASYGIGVSRLAAAIIESSHDDNGIIWPLAVAPFQVCLVNIRQGDMELDRLCESIYTSLIDAGIDVLYDDRNESVGAKLATMDIIGIPWKITLGPKDMKENQVDIVERKSGKKTRCSIDSLVDQVVSRCSVNRTML